MAKTEKKVSISFKTLLFISFLEGFTVMTIELAGGKVLSAYFGSSFFVWTLILALTMLGLAFGYLKGGKISATAGTDLKKRITFNLLLGSCCVFFSPLIANHLFSYAADWGFYSGLFICASVLLLPALFFYGSLCSMIIQLSAQDSERSGYYSGRVFALSTAGGIFAAYLNGFFIIPQFGISFPLLLTAGISVAVCVLFMFRSVKPLYLGTSVVLFIACSVATYKKVNRDSSPSFTIHHQSEGILGQLKVIDYDPPGQHFTIRKLLINGIPQTNIINDPAAYTFWRYPHFIAAYSTLKKEGSTVLLAGLGGGSVARELMNLKFKTDVVEMDKRIPPLANDFFYLDTTAFNIYIDDIRHYIKTCNRKYDIVIYDVVAGEVQPNFAFTREALNEVRKILNPGGQIIVNFQGILEESETGAFHALYQTFHDNGLKVHYWATNPKAFDDIVFLLSENEPDFNKIDTTRFSECCSTLPLMKSFLQNPASVLKTSPDKAGVLTDDNPKLDFLNRKSIVSWRKEMQKDISNKELQEGLSIFK